MEKKLKDFLHLYLGCDIMIRSEKSKMDVNELSALYVLSETHRLEDNIKLILRPLSDMKENEKLESGLMNYSFPEHTPYLPKDILYLLSKHFDIFGLIESGLAIDATKLPVEQ